MRIAVYGGSFNPPHLGHLNSAIAAAEQLKPDRFLVIPGHQPPHKTMEAGSPSPEERLELCRKCFADVPNAEVSDIEIRRGGKSYTADTVEALQRLYPGAELYLLMGTDMLLDLGRWYRAEFIMQNVIVAPFQRDTDELVYIEAKAEELRSRFGAKVEIINSRPFPASSSDIRQLLRQRQGVELLGETVYACIIRKRLYGAKVSLPWLREKAYAMLKPNRVAHVRGCEQEAVALAKRWGADPEDAAEAAILHDCTKKARLQEQLSLCASYGVRPDALERRNEKLLHAKTGAALAQAEFGVSDAVAEAIRWHTTGKPEMTLAEKIIYMADYIEPNRDFEGVDKLRELAYKDLDRAMLLGLEMSIEENRRYGNEIHKNSLAARDWFQKLVNKKEEASV